MGSDLREFCVERISIRASNPAILIELVAFVASPKFEPYARLVEEDFKKYDGYRASNHFIERHVDDWFYLWEAVYDYLKNEKHD